MKTKILLFAQLKELAKAGHIYLELNEPCTVQQLLNQLGGQHPQLKPELAFVKVAINGVYASAGQSIQPSTEVALLPPISGG